MWYSFAEHYEDMTKKELLSAIGKLEKVRTVMHNTTVNWQMYTNIVL